MKKIIILFMLVLCIPLTVAGQGTQQQNEAVENRIMEQVSVRGLEEAVINAKDNETKEKLNSALERIQEHKRERLQQRLMDMEVTEDEEGNTVIEGKTAVKLFGFINMYRNQQYLVDEEGELTRQKRMFDFMFKFMMDDA